MGFESFESVSPLRSKKSESLVSKTSEQANPAFLRECPSLFGFVLSKDFLPLLRPPLSYLMSMEGSAQAFALE